MNRRVNYNSSHKNTAEKKQANRRKSKKRFFSSSTETSPSAADGAVQGARASKTSQMGILQAWISHHQFSCSDSLQRLLAAPWQSVMTWMVIAIALVLPSALYLGLDNVQRLGQGWQNKAQISVYIRHQAKPLAIEQLQQRLERLPEVSGVSLITPEKAKQEFQQYSGLGDVLKSLETNPLPSVLTVDAAVGHHTPDQLSALQNKLQAEPLVDLVQLDIAWLRRLHQMMNLAQHIVVALAALLAVGVLLIIGNTIRLAIENRRSEIIVLKMVGGTDGFVRRPFLYTGIWYGFGGGAFAALLLFFAGVWLSAPVESLILLYGSEHSLTWLGLNNLLLLLVSSAVIGWLGAWLAVSRHLKDIEPE